MWPKFINSSNHMRKVIITSILQRFDQKNHFSEEWSWFKLNNLGLALGIALKLYASVVKGLKIKVKSSWGAISNVSRSYKGKTGRGTLCSTPPPPPHSE